MIKVFVDTEALCSYPQGGISVYTFNVLRMLTRIASDLRLYSSYATFRPARINAIRQLISTNNIPIQVSHTPLPGRIAIWFPWCAAGMTVPALPDFDLIHATSYIPPLWLRRRKGQPLIITVHDLAFLRHPGKNYVPQSSSTDIHFVKRYVREADAILADSHFTKSEMMDLLGVSGKKIFVAHLGTQFEEMPEELPDDQGRAFLKRYGLADERYFLSTSTLSPRKNYETLLDAFEVFHRKEPASKLVIVGGTGWYSTHLIERIGRMLDSVVWLRGVSTPQLSLLYRRAQGFFLISHYEGFGIPLLEAMTRGCPACYSTGSSMDEIAGGHRH